MIQINNRITMRWDDLELLSYYVGFTQTPLNLYSHTARSTLDVHCNTGSGIVQEWSSNGSAPLRDRFRTGHTIPEHRFAWLKFKIVPFETLKQKFIPK